MKLNLIAKLDRERVHYVDDDRLISSRFNRVYIKKKNSPELVVRLPQPWYQELFGQFRIVRRILRLDQCNVFPIGNTLVIVRKGKVYLYDFESNILKETLTLRNCKQLLPRSITMCNEGFLYFGEYGQNKQRKPVPIYKSVDGGKSWKIVFTFKAAAIKHVHGCSFDPFTKKIWVCTGDFENENVILVANKNFSETAIIGDRQQKYRTCEFLFSENYVHWIMDSPLELSRHVSYCRKTKKIKIGQEFAGPVWHLRCLNKKMFIAANVVEPWDDESYHKSNNKINLYLSEDLNSWKIIATFEKDIWPAPYFKYGSIGITDYPSNSNEFYLSFEAIKTLDGKSYRCSIDE